MHVTTIPNTQMGPEEEPRKKRKSIKRSKKPNLAKLKEVPHYQIIFKISSSPYLEILDFIEEKKCDMVILGRHGETGWMKTVVGSTSEGHEKGTVPDLNYP